MNKAQQEIFDVHDDIVRAICSINEEEPIQYNFYPTSELVEILAHSAWVHGYNTGFSDGATKSQQYHKSL